jgi:hypothetical protein
MEGVFLLPLVNVFVNEAGCGPAAEPLNDPLTTDQGSWLVSGRFRSSWRKGW